MTQRSYRACTLCEATCGIVVETEGREVVSVRGDEDDPFSRGYICPKAYALKDLQSDPDRLRRPVRRTRRGWEEIGWDEAIAEAAENLARVRSRHGPESLAIYLGNPSAHSLGSMLYGRVLIRALGTHQRFSATSVDQTAEDDLVVPAVRRSADGAGAGRRPHRRTCWSSARTRWSRTAA